MKLSSISRTEKAHLLALLRNILRNITRYPKTSINMSIKHFVLVRMINIMRETDTHTRLIRTTRQLLGRNQDPGRSQQPKENQLLCRHLALVQDQHHHVDQPLLLMLLLTLVHVQHLVHVQDHLLVVLQESEQILRELLQHIFLKIFIMITINQV